MKKVTQAVLLAAGESSRFYPYNNLGHKSLVELGGVSLIERTITDLVRRGIFEIVVIESKSKKISSLLKGKFPFIKFVVQEKALGAGDALLKSEKYLSNYFYLLNAYHFELIELIPSFINSVKFNNDIGILVKDESDVSSFGAIEQKNGKVIINEKSKTTTSKTRIVGLYLLNMLFIEQLKKIKSHEDSLEDAISKYSSNNSLVLVQASTPVLSLKYPWDILSAKELILEKTERFISKSAKISKLAKIEGDVFIDDGAKIMEGAVIKGPAYIGKNAFIGNNSVLRDGVLVEEKAVVGANLEVKNSVLMKNATTHSGFVGDSIVGENTKIAASFTTANIRLDRKDVSVIIKDKKVSTGRRAFGAIVGSDVSIGINVGTMPGIIIGNNSIIGPGTTIMENVSDGVSYYTEFRKIVKK